MNWYTPWGLVIVLLLFLIAVVYHLKQISKQNKGLKDSYDKILSQKKSSEVRLGRTGEQMAPFFTAWPYDSNKFRFIGDPVDGIQFGEDEIVFVEIKTGKARLTQSQKNAKQLIKDGKVKFATFRIAEDGCSLKMEDD